MNCATISESKPKVRFLHKNPEQIEIEFVIEKSKTIPEESLLLDELYKCSYKEQGLMWDAFNDFKHKNTSYIIYCKLNSKVIAWSFLFRNDDRHREIMLFVYPKYRKNRIGTRLFKIAQTLNPNKKIKYTGHNRTSIQFFRSVDPKSH
jgi:GNAT superfamily N-acetyltransferase